MSNRQWYHMRMDKSDSFVGFPRADVSKMVSTLLQLGNVLDGMDSKDDPMRTNAHELYAKFFQHVVTAVFLRNSTILQEIPVSFVDTASINVVARSAMESFITYFYIYVLPSDRQTVEFRYWSWWLSGLLSRQKMAERADSVPENIVAERKEVLSIREKIQGNPVFGTLSNKQQRAMVEEGKWRLPGWGKIAKDTGLNSMLSEMVYSFLSTYAHSESASIMQTSQMYHDRVEGSMADTTIGLLMVLSAKMIEAYIKVFPECETAITTADRNFVRQLSEAAGREELTSDAR